MRETNIPNILNHKLQAHSRESRVCKENKLLEEKKDFVLKYFAVKGSALEGCERTATIRIQLIFVTTILYSIKVRNSTVFSN